MRFEREVGGNPTARARSLRRRMTRAEQALWQELRKLDVNFRRQAPIGRYFADLAAHGAKLVGEVDGEVHERLDDVVLRDFERQQWLQTQGYRVLRFTNRQVEANVWSCMEQVKTALGREAQMGAGAEPSHSPHDTAHTTTPAPPPSRRRGA